MKLGQVTMFSLTIATATAILVSYSSFPTSFDIGASAEQGISDHQTKAMTTGTVRIADKMAHKTPVQLAQYKKPTDADLRKRLTPLQYRVTQHEGTEAPFSNQYWNEKRAGIYVDVVSGEPLFSSKDKYKSGTGWPSFTRPLVKGNVVEKSDYSLFGRRVEIRSVKGDSHLGHVFSDGPAPTGLRYCMNSAAMRFIPANELSSKGYGQFASRFKLSKGKTK